MAWRVDPRRSSHVGPGVDYGYGPMRIAHIGAPDLTGHFRVSEWRPDTALSWGTSPAVTAIPAPRVDPDTSLTLRVAHLSIAGEVCLSPCGGAAPSGR